MGSHHNLFIRVISFHLRLNVWFSYSYLQDDQTPFEVASDRRNYKVIKALLKKKYPVRWRFKLQKLNVKRSSSLTRLPTSPTTNSISSDAESSVCSEININTSEFDLDGMDD